MKNKIFYLTGFMAAGKSTIGPILANTLGWDFIDLDKEIEKRAGMKIADIFKDKGEKFFRQLETGSLKELSGLNRVIISLGGGTIVSKMNLNIIRSTGKMIYLKSSPEEAFKRLKHKRDRPALIGEDYENNMHEKLKERIDSMMEEREKYYKKADYVIETNIENVGLTVDRIARYINDSIHPGRN